MRISVVIPTLNGGPGFVALLDALRAQTPRAPDEIIVVDSGSRDGTPDHARQRGARVLEAPRPFDHGLARDAGIAASSGEIVVLTVQDALPASPDWLERMTRHFADPRVAGVSGRQVPPPDGPLELQIRTALDAQQGLDPVRVDLRDHPKYSDYSPSERVELYRFDDVTSALRRSVWAALPFGQATYAEDMLWARKAIEAGHAIVRDPSATVIHAHRRGFSYEFRRGLLDAQMMDALFGYRYSFFRRLNRATALLGPGTNNAPRPGLRARLAAARTYAAHALARVLYNTLRFTGLSTWLVRRWTKGI